MRGGSHSSDADDRWNCLMAVARELKLDVLPELTVQLQLRVSTPELGFGPTNELLKRGADFTALVCYNDIAAIGAIRAFMNHGLRVPEDISVVGFDDIQGAAFHNPSLTTIRQPLPQMGNGCRTHPAAADSRPGDLPRRRADPSRTGDSRVDLPARIRDAPAGSGAERTP